MNAENYPPLPEPNWHDCKPFDGAHYAFYTADQMRAYVDTDRASRPASAMVGEIGDEREAFKSAHQHLDLTEVPEAWGQSKFVNTHVDALWTGWKQRAILALRPAAAEVPAVVVSHKTQSMSDKAACGSQALHNAAPAAPQGGGGADAQPAPDDVDADGFRKCVKAAAKHGYAQGTEQAIAFNEGARWWHDTAPAQAGSGQGGDAGSAQIVYRWQALDYSGFCYGSNPPDDLPARCNLTAFHRQPEAFQAALHEISATGNLTATPQQFARHLQKVATDALTGGFIPDPAEGNTAELRSALNAMLTYFGMDEDEFSKGTLDQARRALAAPAPQGAGDAEALMHSAAVGHGMRLNRATSATP